VIGSGQHLLLIDGQSHTLQHVTKVGQVIVHVAVVPPATRPNLSSVSCRTVSLFKANFERRGVCFIVPASAIGAPPGSEAFQTLSVA
jgi:hypothetical protein